MKIVIVGAGALGRLLGAFLARGGHTVSFVEKDQEVVKAINDKGIGVGRPEASDTDQIVYTPAKAYTAGSEIKECDVLLMAVKSYSSYEAAHEIKHLVTASSPLITLQNGLDHLEKIATVVEPENIIAGFTLLAGTALGPGEVIDDREGKTYIGEQNGIISKRLEKISSMLNECGLETMPVNDIVRRTWCKVIVHAAINPVAAMLRHKNGVLLESMESLSLMKRLIDEGKEVARVSGLELGCPDLYDILFESCRNTYNHLAPMLQDIINGRKTEVDSLNGALFNYGKRNGYEAITHLTMLELVKSLEKTSGTGRMLQERF